MGETKRKHTIKSLGEFLGPDGEFLGGLITPIMDKIFYYLVDIDSGPGEAPHLVFQSLDKPGRFFILQELDPCYKLRFQFYGSEFRKTYDMSRIGCTLQIRTRNDFKPVTHSRTIYIGEPDYAQKAIRWIDETVLMETNTEISALRPPYL